MLPVAMATRTAQNMVLASEKRLNVELSEEDRGTASA